MRKITFVFACLGTAMALAAATPAHAQNYHSFVSGAGTGTACTFTAPCVDFQTALAVTNSLGIISCVDQGADSRGSFLEATSISQSVTIDCAGTSATSASITINGAGIVVTLRNLNMLAPAGANRPGIDFQNGAALFVEHCVIENLNVSGGGTVGILFEPSASAKLHVTDSVIKNNGSDGGGGIFIEPTGGARVVIERTQVENNTYGIFANATNGTTLVEVRDSTVANNAAYGIWAYTTGPTASIVFDHSSSVYNGANGITAQGTGAFVSLTDSTVVGNAVGLAAVSGGGIGSYGNNRENGNLNDGTSPTGVALK